MIPLLVACSSPMWTPDGALAPHRARLDTNTDSRVSAAEYDAHRWNGPPFATADQNGDGDLSASELVWLVRTQSPTSFDAPIPQPPLALGQTTSTRPTAAQRELHEVFVWMDDSLRAAGDAPLDAAVLSAAADSGRVDSPEAVAAFAQLRPRWEARGWGWPEGW